MPKWARGEAEIEQLLARGELERVAGAAADGTPLLEQIPDIWKLPVIR